ncbi:MAG: TlpA family protein disulfide reductase [Deltaproteobacteria bacterium]|nr:TlpA family protein disulfide reductase [Deltaproteobacteria bacterium]
MNDTKENSEEQTDNKKSAMIKNGAIIIGVIAIFIMLSSVLEAGPLKEGTVAPDFKLPVANVKISNSNEVIRLSDYKGKVVVLDFWSTTCPPCIAEINVLKRLKEKMGSKDVEFIGLAVGGESFARIEKFAKNRMMNYPTGPDLRGVAATSYKVSSLPTLFIIDKNGVIRDSDVGYQPETVLVEKINRVLK